MRYLLTPCSRVLLEKLTGFQLINKFPTFYGTRRFITAFTSARHLSLSWASLIQSIPPHPTSWRSILMLSSHLCLVSQVVPFPQVSPPKPCTHLYSPPYILHALPNSFWDNNKISLVLDVVVMLPDTSLAVSSTSEYDNSPHYHKLSLQQQCTDVKTKGSKVRLTRFSTSFGFQIKLLHSFISNCWYYKVNSQHRRVRILFLSASRLIHTSQY